MPCDARPLRKGALQPVHLGLPSPLLLLSGSKGRNFPFQRAEQKEARSGRTRDRTRSLEISIGRSISFGGSRNEEDRMADGWGMATRLAGAQLRLPRIFGSKRRMDGPRCFSRTPESAVQGPEVDLAQLQRRVDACNTIVDQDLANFVPFRIDGKLLGYMKEGFASQIERYGRVFVRRGGGIEIHERLQSEERRTEEVGEVLQQLRENGTIVGWRQELFPVRESFHDDPMLLLERAAVPHFGIKAYGVHMNGFVKDSNGKEFLWVARRSPAKPTFPGMLDHLVAGGQGQIGCMDNVIKEAEEEAGIPRELAMQAKSVGAVSYRMRVDEGVKQDVLYVYDLELPADFVPQAMDGEVEQFMLWPIDRVIDSVANTQNWKPNCTLVVIDFLIRHGHIHADQPGYLKLLGSLRQADLS